MRLFIRLPINGTPSLLSIIITSYRFKHLSPSPFCQINYCSSISFKIILFKCTYKYVVWNFFFFSFKKRKGLSQFLKRNCYRLILFTLNYRPIKNCRWKNRWKRTVSDNIPSVSPCTLARYFHLFFFDFHPLFFSSLFVENYLLIIILIHRCRIPNFPSTNSIIQKLQSYQSPKWQGKLNQRYQDYESVTPPYAVNPIKL